LEGGDPLLFDPGLLAVKGNRRLVKSALASDDKSMREELVGKVSGEPLFVPDEISDETPVERPREESETFSVSRGTEGPEARFAMGCAISLTDRCRWVGAAVDRGGDDAELNAALSDPDVGAEVRIGRFAPTAPARLLNLGCWSDVLFAS
jgi:hypothetical protein